MNEKREPIKSPDSAAHKDFENEKELLSAVGLICLALESGSEDDIKKASKVIANSYLFSIVKNLHEAVKVVNEGKEEQDQENADQSDWEIGKTEFLMNLGEFIYNSHKMDIGEGDPSIDEQARLIARYPQISDRLEKIYKEAQRIESMTGVS